METTTSVFPIKEEPELNIPSDTGDDTGYTNDYDNGEDEENVNILRFILTLSSIDLCFHFYFSIMIVECYKTIVLLT